MPTSTTSVSRTTADSSVQPSLSTTRETLFAGAFAWRDALLFSTLFGVAVANKHLMTMVLLGLAGWALSGPRQAFLAMSLVAVLRYANEGFASFSPFASILFWLIMMLGSARIYLSLRRVPPSYIWLFAFSLVAIATSVAVSRAPDVSLMKIVSFFIVSSAVLVGSVSLSRADIERLQRWFVSAAIAIAGLSLLTLASPGIAFRLNGTGFQGIFAHPQHLGVMLVPFVAWGLMRAFNNRKVRVTPLQLLLIVAGVIIIVMTRARTAMLAAFVAVLLTTGVHLLRSQALSYRKHFGQIAGIGIFLGLVLVIGLSTGGGAALFEEIAFKGSGTADLQEAFEVSRGAGVSQHLDNFADAPLTGHGFGVYRHGVAGGERGIVRLWGIPISAPAEKGFAFTAVLEEVGIVGGFLFYGLLLSMARSAARSQRPEILALLLGAVMINFGEAVIFSPGGIGLFMWLVMGVALAGAHYDADDRKNRTLANRT